MRAAVWPHGHCALKPLWGHHPATVPLQVEPNSERSPLFGQRPDWVGYVQHFGIHLKTPTLVFAGSTPISWWLDLQVLVAYLLPTSTILLVFPLICWSRPKFSSIYIIYPIGSNLLIYYAAYAVYSQSSVLVLLVVTKWQTHSERILTCENPCARVVGIGSRSWESHFMGIQPKRF